MELKQTASERLAIITADAEATAAAESAATSAALLAEFQQWATIDPLSEDLAAGLQSRSGLAELQKRVFKIKRPKKSVNVAAAIQTIVAAARAAGYVDFGVVDEYLKSIIIGYEYADLNYVINNESLQPDMLSPTDLFTKISQQVSAEADQAIVLFAAQALKMLNSGVCNQLQLIIPPASAASFMAKYQSTLEAGGFIVYPLMDGYKVLYPNPGSYDMPCQLAFAHAEAAVSAMRANQIGVQ